MEAPATTTTTTRTRLVRRAVAEAALVNAPLSAAMLEEIVDRELATDNQTRADIRRAGRRLTAIILNANRLEPIDALPATLENFYRACVLPGRPGTEGVWRTSFSKIAERLSQRRGLDIDRILRVSQRRLITRLSQARPEDQDHTMVQFAEWMLHMVAKDELRRTRPQLYEPGMIDEAVAGIHATRSKREDMALRRSRRVDGSLIELTDPAIHNETSRFSVEAQQALATPLHDVVCHHRSECHSGRIALTWLWRVVVGESLVWDLSARDLFGLAHTVARDIRISMRLTEPVLYDDCALGTRRERDAARKRHQHQKPCVATVVINALADAAGPVSMAMRGARVVWAGVAMEGKIAGRAASEVFAEDCTALGLDPDETLSFIRRERGRRRA